MMVYYLAANVVFGQTNVQFKFEKIQFVADLVVKSL